MISKKILFLILLLCCYFFVLIPKGFAADIETTFGKVFKGEVIEETKEYIRIQTKQGDIYKIRHKHIASRSDRSALQEGTGEASFEEKWDTEYTLEDWEKWMAENENFLNTMERMQQNFMRIMSSSTDKINKYFQSGKTKEGLQAGQSAGAEIRRLKKKVSEMKPSELLAGYHEKVIASFTYEIKSMDAWLFGDQHIYYRYHKRAINSFIDGLEELGRAHQRMGAPGYISGDLEFTVQRLREGLGERYN